MAPISQNRGVVTEKTDKQANRLVKRRKKVKGKLKKIEEKRASGKKVILGNLREKILKKRKKRIQKKINANPTAQKWRKDGKAKPSGGKLSKLGATKGRQFRVTGPHESMHSRIGGGPKKKGGYKTGGFRDTGASWIESGAASLDD
jgi:hypothetical protein